MPSHLRLCQENGATHEMGLGSPIFGAIGTVLSLKGPKLPDIRYTTDT